MPTISIFIRKDDLPKWQALEHKSQWISERLNAGAIALDSPEVIKAVGEQLLKMGSRPCKHRLPYVPKDLQLNDGVGKIFNAVCPDCNEEFVYEQKPASTTSQLSQCPHYRPKGQCLVKGCKYDR